MTTCQICGRAIKAPRGLIARHGFRRRGGWQSASCFGAGWRPFEVACDALPIAIDKARAFVAQQDARAAELKAAAPDRLTVVTRRNMYGPTETRELERPADWPQTIMSRTCEYARAYRARLVDHTRAADMVRPEIAELAKRLASWHEPERT